MASNFCGAQFLRIGLQNISQKYFLQMGSKRQIKWHTGSMRDWENPVENIQDDKQELQIRVTVMCDCTLRDVQVLPHPMLALLPSRS